MVIKTYGTLVQDIQEVLSNGIDDLYDNFIDDFSRDVSRVVQEKLKDRNRIPTLRMSNIGTPCSRKLWYLINNPEKAEGFSPETYLKFVFGDLTEEFLLFLVKLAGHRVEGRQLELELQGIKGHNDVIIDGLLTDVKSAATYSFKKFEEHNLMNDDPFGYIDQLFGYLEALQNNPLLEYKDRAAFLVMEKQHGHLCLDVYKKEELGHFDIRKIYDYRKELVKQEEVPARHYDDENFQLSGNKKLGINCSYCEFKKHCWPGLRTFIYSGKPLYLTEVVKEPRVFEVKDEEGNLDG